MATSAAQSKYFLTQLVGQEGLEVVVESYEGAIYQAFVKTESGERLIWDDEKTPLKARCLTAMQERLYPLKCERLFLRHNSAYDEMIGHTSKAGGNTLLIPIHSEVAPLS